MLLECAYRHPLFAFDAECNSILKGSSLSYSTRKQIFLSNTNNFHAKMKSRNELLCSKKCFKKMLLS